MSSEKEKPLKAEAKRAVARAERKLREKTFPNQYPGICTSCRQTVAKDQGIWSKGKVFCKGCAEFLNAGP